ncbi:MAG TPA: hypothetical protein VGR47_04425 [Terracidiphilus sp.]|nr:hypothetical protein [Terracidiphilus sp.]
MATSPTPLAGNGDPDSSQLLAAVLNTLQAATSPDVLEAQSIILRRIALEGDVVGSPIPAPANISQVGCWLNLLTTLNETVIRQQAIAGALGVAGPNPPLGWISNAMPLSFITITNDIPAGQWPAMPLTVTVRSDFASFLQAQLTKLHNQGCLLPMQAQPIYLPPSAPGTIAPADPLPYLGRALDLYAGAALNNTASDALVVAKSGAGIQVMASTSNAAAVPPATYTAYQWNSGSKTMTTASITASLVAVAPQLQAAGFFPASTAAPTAPMPAPWAHFTNITGLIPGVTKLGDELSLIYNWTTIMNSVFANSLTWVWNGTQFASS